MNYCLCGFHLWFWISTLFSCIVLVRFCTSCHCFFPSTVISCSALIASTCSLLTCPSSSIKVHVFPTVLVCFLFCGFWTLPDIRIMDFAFAPVGFLCLIPAFDPQLFQHPVSFCVFYYYHCPELYFLGCLHLSTQGQNQEEEQNGIFPYFCQTGIFFSSFSSLYLNEKWGLHGKDLRTIESLCVSQIKHN